jgi:hypothetical protein
MMMVVTVMAVALHLLKPYGETPFGVKYFCCRRIPGREGLGSFIFLWSPVAV